MSEFSNVDMARHRQCDVPNATTLSVSDRFYSNAGLALESSSVTTLSRHHIRRVKQSSCRIGYRYRKTASAWFILQNYKEIPSFMWFDPSSFVYGDRLAVHRFRSACNILIHRRTIDWLRLRSACAANVVKQPIETRGVLAASLVLLPCHINASFSWSFLKATRSISAATTYVQFYAHSQSLLHYGPIRTQARYDRRCFAQLQMTLNGVAMVALTQASKTVGLWRPGAYLFVAIGLQMNQCNGTSRNSPTKSAMLHSLLYDHQVYAGGACSVVFVPTIHEQRKQWLTVLIETAAERHA